jgi:hypothetical protein
VRLTISLPEETASNRIGRHPSGPFAAIESQSRAPAPTDFSSLLTRQFASIGAVEANQQPDGAAPEEARSAGEAEPGPSSAIPGTPAVLPGTDLQPGRTSFPLAVTAGSLREAGTTRATQSPGEEALVERGTKMPETLKIPVAQTPAVAPTAARPSPPAPAGKNAADIQPAGIKLHPAPAAATAASNRYPLPHPDPAATKSAGDPASSVTASSERQASTAPSRNGDRPSAPDTGPYTGPYTGPDTSIAMPPAISMPMAIFPPQIALPGGPSGYASQQQPVKQGTDIQPASLQPASKTAPQEAPPDTPPDPSSAPPPTLPLASPVSAQLPGLLPRAAEAKPAAAMRIAPLPPSQGEPAAPVSPHSTPAPGISDSNEGIGFSAASIPALNGRPPAPEAGIVAAAADPFQRLDQAASPGAVLHSASNRIEVGVHDPAMGWLEIRTQSAAGQLSAALVATSSEAHAALAAQLPGMTQYLADHDVKLNHVAVEQQPSGAGPDGHSSSRQDGGGGGQQNHSAAYHVHDPPASWFPSGGDEEMEAEQLSYISVRA